MLESSVSHRFDGDARRRRVREAWIPGALLALGLWLLAAPAPAQTAADSVGAPAASPPAAASADRPEPGIAREPDAPDAGTHAAPPTVTTPVAAPITRAATPAAPTTSAGTSAPAPSDAPPADLNDLAAWLSYKQRHAIAALPDEARLFYRRGLMAQQAGESEAAMHMVRGASELDPSFPDPYLTLGSWLLARDPGQAVTQYARLFDVTRQSFPLQLQFEANAAYAVAQAMILALLLIGLMIVIAHAPQIQHRWQEAVARFAPRPRARLWSWVLFLAPFALGLGPALPTVFLLGVLWPLLKWSERAVFTLLVAALVSTPFMIVQFDRIGSPLREDREPLFGVSRLENARADDALEAHLAELARSHPENPFVQFGRAWVARRNQDLAIAETSYRRALELWPNDDRVLNNLGNVLSLLGRDDEALEMYERAAKLNPYNAATHYNRARIYTARYDFRAAADAMARASALNFDPLKPYLTQNPSREALPPADLWISPSHFWNALARYRPTFAVPLALPPFWRNRVEFAGWPFGIAALVAALLGLGLGAFQHRRLPLRYCGNCGHVVCRRCAERRREVALCAGCAAVERRAQAWDYGTLLLSQHRRKVLARDRTVRTALAALLPGYGWVVHRRVFAAWLLLALSAGFVTVWLGIATPFTYLPSLYDPGDVPSIPWIVGVCVAVWLVSIAGYALESRRERFRLAAQGRTPLRSRRTTAARAA